MSAARRRIVGYGNRWRPARLGGLGSARATTRFDSRVHGTRTLRQATSGERGSRRERHPTRLDSTPCPCCGYAVGMPWVRYVYAMCMLCVCYVHALYMLCACCVHAMCMLCVCYVYALCMPGACYVHAMRMRYACCVYAMCRLCVCYVYALCMLCACYECTCCVHPITSLPTPFRPPHPALTTTATVAAAAPTAACLSLSAWHICCSCYLPCLP